MKSYGCLILLVSHLTVTNSALFSKFLTNLRTFLKSDAKENGRFDGESIQNSKWAKKWQFDRAENRALRRRSESLRSVKKYLKMDPESSITGETDPVRGLVKGHNFRRKLKSSISTSSSREFRDWKEEFRDEWHKKKFEAINSSQPGGDMVNVLAARPWGVQCGDPNQHDLPWGSCMLAMECEPEYRIQRGDYACGRTRYVCCALNLETYDMNQGFDISLYEMGQASTNSDEKKEKLKTSKEVRKKKTERDRKRRLKVRNARKKKIQRNIKKIVKEITNILNKQFRNATKGRKGRVKVLKKFIRDLKKQYRHDRQALKDLDQKNNIVLDNELMKKLKNLKEMNEKFVKNDTFREILQNGKMSFRSARMLSQSYPELGNYIKHRPRRRNMTRRSQGGPASALMYDTEYGILYY